MPPKPRPRFAVERDGQDIMETRIRHGVSTGLSFGRVLPGMVPLYEEMESMRFAGYTPRAWQDLDSDERAAGVAHYRMHQLVEMHKEDAVADKMKRKTERSHGH